MLLRLLILFLVLLFLADDLPAQDSTRTFRVSNVFRIRRDHSYSKNILVIGPSVAAGVDRYFSVGAGLHLDWIRVAPGGRMGHWRYFHFLFDYRWSYCFAPRLLLREDMSLTFFKVYTGLGYSGPWINGRVRVSRYTDRTSNDYFISPMVGVSYGGMIDLNAGLQFFLKGNEESFLKNTVVVEVIYRPLHSYNPGI